MIITTINNGQEFESEYGYSIILPNNWSEYELEDEGNTNGFFDTSKWTGNLRITPLEVQVDNPFDFIKKELNGTDYIELFWDNINAIHYFKESDDLYIYYWNLIESKKIYICSFTIDSENKESKENQRELEKIEGIIKTLKSK